MPAALFGITDDTLNLVVNLLVLFLAVLWLALVAWTYFDARRRLVDSVLVGSAAAAALIFPFLGAIVYSILRPPEFLDDRRERELETRAAELRLRQLEEQSCPNCEHPIERTFLRCPDCRARIKDPCESCGKPIDPRWSVCPYCETPVRRAAPPERRPAKSRGAKRQAASRSGREAGRAASSRQGARKARPGKERVTQAKQERQGGSRSTSSPPPGRERSGDDDPRPAPAS